VYDIVVVGGGTAGTVLAGRLSQDAGRSVALLEAGPDRRVTDMPPGVRSGSPTDVMSNAARYESWHWRGLTARPTTAQPPSPCPRGRGTGGSSQINYMLAPRPNLSDFERWIDRGCTGWSPAEVLRSFNAAESDQQFGDRAYHGAHGPIPIHRAARSEWSALDTEFERALADAGEALEEDLNRPDATGVGPWPVNVRLDGRVSTNEAYLEPARARQNLTVLGDTLVDRVLVDNRTSAATGVRYLAYGETREVEAGMVILAAGAVHSPAILQRSGVGPATWLRAANIPVSADLPVGVGLQDHPRVVLQLDGEPTAGPANGRAMNVLWRASSGSPDGCPGDLFVFPMSSLGATAPWPDGVVVLLNQCYSTGTVRIRSADPAAHPSIDQRMLEDTRDLSRLREAVQRTAGLIRSTAFGRSHEVVAAGTSTRIEDLNTAQLERWMLATATSGRHLTSSCAMGAADLGDAVVDHEGVVHGVANLRVIDSSIAPMVPTANTHLTTIMIAEHLAARIAG
jgi:choline dehydrogenase